MRGGRAEYDSDFGLRLLGHATFLFFKGGLDPKAYFDFQDIGLQSHGRLGGLGLRPQRNFQGSMGCCGPDVTIQIQGSWGLDSVRLAWVLLRNLT